jgi:deoxyribodipyrimidine photo-lyase
MTKTSIILFNSDLRTTDNPAFFHALKNSQKIIPIFILDEKNQRELGGAAKWFLHHALESLALELQKKYSLKLILKKGDSLKILAEIFEQEKIDALYFNQLCEPYAIKLLEDIKKTATKNSIEVFTFKSQTLFNFDEIKTKAGGYFKVFTPFFNECKRSLNKIEKLLPAPQSLDSYDSNSNIKNDNLDLLPKKDWAKNFSKFWIFDYKKIEKNLDNFLEKKVANYQENRNFPALDGNSKMSPYLTFGLISPKQIFFKIENYIAKNGYSENVNQFLAELCWREFCHHLLFNFPQLPDKSFKKEFDKFPWIKDEISLKKWQKGQTGYPIVDAGMLELWATGTMHNRVRMVVASFLIKHLLIDWREGEKWFWHCLVDANLANNVANWQWVAGSGADAAPYFRIFNPTLQGERFDVDGEYVKKWLPQLSKLPKKFIHEPWKADSRTLEYCGLELGKNYPNRIVEHEKARDMAMMIYKSL